MGASVPDSKFFGIPFALSGDRATIPEAVDPGGAVSFTQGFGPDYERDPGTDPLAKRVPRDESNEIYYQVTNTLRYLQIYGLPEWYALDDAGNPVSYPVQARVRHLDQTWVSLVATNTVAPGSDPTKWAPMLVVFPASTTVAGIVELATPAEAKDPSIVDRAVTPQGLAGFALERLTANRTFYVRTDGNDANSGDTNTSGGAFQTLQGAYNAIRSRFFSNGYTVTLQLGVAGTYVGFSHSTWPGDVVVLGNIASPDSFILTAPGGALQPLTVQGGKTLSATGVRLVAPANGRCAWAFGGDLNTQNVTWVGINTGVHLLAEAGGTVSLDGSHTIIATSNSFINLTGGARVYLGGGGGFTGTLSGAATFLGGFVAVRESSAILVRGSSGFVGSANGRRFVASLNSILNTNGGGASFFLGDQAGELTTGAQYA